MGQSTSAARQLGRIAGSRRFSDLSMILHQVILHSRDREKDYEYDSIPQ